MTGKLARYTAVVLTSGLTWAVAPLLAGQAVESPQPARQGRLTGPAPPQVIVQSEASAERTREQLERVLEKYPPSLGSVLRLDPSLAANSAYLAPYPVLSAFLNQHPEVA